MTDTREDILSLAQDLEDGVQRNGSMDGEDGSVDLYDIDAANEVMGEAAKLLRTLAAAPTPPATEAPEYRCPKCGAAADERWDCCQVAELTAAEAFSPADFVYNLRCRMLTTAIPLGEPVIHTFDRCAEAMLAEACTVPTPPAAEAPGQEPAAWQVEVRGRWCNLPEDWASKDCSPEVEYRRLYAAPPAPER